MTTVIDPAGTPIPVYNRSGTTIIPVSGGSPSTPTPIVSVSGITVAVTTRSMSGDAYELPTLSEIGDVVEVLPGDGNTVDVCAPAGETVRTSGQASVGAAGSRFRKINATQWV